MDAVRLHEHVKLCRRNLKSGRVKCCAWCPFEDEITKRYPELKDLFVAKREAQQGGASEYYRVTRTLQQSEKARQPKRGR